VTYQFVEDVVVESHVTPCVCGHVRGQHSLATPRPCDKCECGSFSPMSKGKR
jgi:UDP-2,3-diacylglucosamine pyrophosphatase LpxH